MVRTRIMRPLFLLMVGCVLLLRGATSIPAQSFSVQSAQANVSRWMYPFNQNPGARPTASTFAAFGNTGTFDTRDGQYLLGWNTSNYIPVGQGARNYLVRRVHVTLTISSFEPYYVYSDTLRDYRTYFPTNDPNYLTTTNSSSPIELYGVGFRGGYAATNYPADGPFFVNPIGGDYTNRVAYAACFDTNGVLVDVSNNVGDDGTNEIANPFEVAPFAVGVTTNVTPGQLMPAGSQLIFDVNLNDPLIYGYVQRGLNDGNLSFIASALVNANFFSGTPNWPDFYTISNAFATAAQKPLLDIDGTIVRTNLDTDGDGLPDDWEQFAFGSLSSSGTNDMDGDGANNMAEYIAGTNPTDSSSRLRCLWIDRQTNATELCFEIAANRQYAVEWSDNLQAWQEITNPVLSYTSAWLSKTGTNLVYPSPLFAVWRDTNTVNQQRFYRVRIP